MVQALYSSGSVNLCRRNGGHNSQAESRLGDCMSGLDRMANRKTDKNGYSLSYDRDKMPPGFDPEVWDLTLFFEQQAEHWGHSIVGRPIVYMELNNRINNSDIRHKFVDWHGMIREMIESFWSYELDPDKSYYAINEFCRIDIFNQLSDSIEADRERKKLLKEGTRDPESDREKKSPRRSEEDTRALEIINKQYTEEELAEKLREFRSRK